jgi:acetylornithine/succinyldiaminopimelate/putrescine aminotransferase
MEDRLDLVKGHRGKGLLQAIVLSRDAAEEVVRACLERGLIVNNVRPDAVRICPPLTITREELDEGLAILESVFVEKGGSASK